MNKEGKNNHRKIASLTDRSDFLELASHQLRTPFAVASLYTDMILAGHAGPLSAEQRKLIEEVDFYHKKMNVILTEFLISSKMQLGLYEPHPEHTSISDRLEVVLVDVAGDIKRKKLKVIKAVDPNLPFIWVDPDLLRIVIYRLMAQAVKFSPDGGRVDLIVKRIGKKVMVIVKDKGEGMRRDGKYPRGRQLASGFGVQVIAELAELGGGKLFVESGARKGTTFTLELSLVKAN